MKTFLAAFLALLCGVSFAAVVPIKDTKFVHQITETTVIRPQDTILVQTNVGAGQKTRVINASNFVNAIGAFVNFPAGGTAGAFVRNVGGIGSNITVAAAGGTNALTVTGPVSISGSLSNAGAATLATSLTVKGNQTNEGTTVLDVSLLGNSGGTVTVGSTLVLSTPTGNRALYLTAGKQVASAAITQSELESVTGKQTGSGNLTNLSASASPGSTNASVYVGSATGSGTNIAVRTAGGTNALTVTGAASVSGSQSNAGPVTLASSLQVDGNQTNSATTVLDVALLGNSGGSVTVGANLILAAPTGNRALYLTAGKQVASSAITQSQLESVVNKLNAIDGIGTNATIKGITEPNLTASRATMINSAGVLTNVTSASPSSDFVHADGTVGTIAGSGDVVGPAPATDNAIVKFDGTSGKLIQNSGTLLGDDGAITGVSAITSTNLATSGTNASRQYRFDGGQITNGIAHLSGSTNLDFLTLVGAMVVSNGVLLSTSEANDGQNVGSGTAIYAGKSGVHLQLNSFAAGDASMTISSNANVLSFTARGATNNTTESLNWLSLSNGITHTVTNLGSATSGTLDWAGPDWAHLQTSGNYTLSFANAPSAGAKGQQMHLDVFLGGSHTVTWPSGIDWRAATSPPIVSGVTNGFTFRFDGTNLIGYAEQENTTGSDLTVLRTSPTLSNTVTIAGTPAGQTGFLRIMDNANAAYTAFSAFPLNGGPTNSLQFALTNPVVGQYIAITRVVNNSGGQVDIYFTNLSQTAIVASNQVAGVLSNLTGVAASTVTNELSTALQINTGTLTLSSGVLSNLNASTIDVPVGNLVSNVSNIKFAAVLPAITTSNLVLSFATNTYHCIGLTNLVLTNLVEEATGVIVPEMKVYVQNTIGANVALVWPAYGAQHGYFFRTNANNPVLQWAAVTNAKSAVISFSCIGTNVFSSITEWP